MIPRKRKYLNEFYIKTNHLKLTDSEKLDEFEKIWNISLDAGLNISEVIDGYVEKAFKLENKVEDVFVPEIPLEKINKDAIKEDLEEEITLTPKKSGRPKK
jgi:hypothetical protein